MKSLRARILTFFTICLLGTLLDLGTKSWIFHRLGFPGEQGVWWLIPDIFGFQTSLNQGALFGMGQGQIALFVSLSFFALIGIFLMLVFDKQKSLFFAFVLGLICAGIAGNLWDRLGLHEMNWPVFAGLTQQCSPDLVGKPIHAVRDWILVMIGPHPWPNFNLADSFLVSGAILLGIYSFFGSSEETADGSTKKDPGNSTSLPSSSESEEAKRQ
ncbi:MAG: signal peptidase II [Planctomycetia bacterium]|nr:signal peptidase II [Planctomycetia bacterium]